MDFGLGHALNLVDAMPVLEQLSYKHLLHVLLELVQLKKMDEIKVLK